MLMFAAMPFVFLAHPDFAAVHSGTMSAHFTGPLWKCLCRACTHLSVPLVPAGPMRPTVPLRPRTMDICRAERPSALFVLTLHGVANGDCLITRLACADFRADVCVACRGAGPLPERHSYQRFRFLRMTPVLCAECVSVSCCAVVNRGPIGASPSPCVGFVARCDPNAGTLTETWGPSPGLICAIVLSPFPRRGVAIGDDHERAERHQCRAKRHELCSEPVSHSPAAASAAGSTRNCQSPHSRSGESTSLNCTS